MELLLLLCVFFGNLCGRRAEKEWLLREKIRLHAERVRDHRAQIAENPAEDMRSAQRELEIVSVSLCGTVVKPRS